MTDTPEAVLRAWFEEVWNRGDESAIDRLFHPEGVFNGLPTSDAEPIRGPLAFRPFHQAFRSAFPDLSIEILQTVTEGDLTVAYCRVRGTHRGSGLMVPATHNGIDFRGFAMGRIKDGQIVEGWNAFDFMGMYQQLGVGLNLPAAE